MAAGDRVGYSVSGVGDTNGDGGHGVIIGATYVDNNDREDSGSAYILYDEVPKRKKKIYREVSQKEQKKTGGRVEACTKVTYENSLEVPRKVRLADLVKGKGVKVRASANRESEGTLKLELEGEDARYFKLYGKKSHRKSKTVAHADVKVSSKPRDIYIKMRGKARKLIKRALHKKKTPKRVRLKVTLATLSVANKQTKRRNSLTVMALKGGKVRSTKTHTKIRRVIEENECAKPLKANIEGPRRVKLTSLVSGKGGQGKGVKLKVSCSLDCTAQVRIKMWSRYEVGLKFRKMGKKKGRWLSSRKLNLKGRKTKTLTLKGPSSRRLRKLLLRGAKRKRYRRIKLKYSIDARTNDGIVDENAGTLRVLLRSR